MTTWTPRHKPGPNHSADPADHSGDHTASPSKPDFALVQIAKIRDRLGRPGTVHELYDPPETPNRRAS